jgi:hypothetical protein
MDANVQARKTCFVIGPMSNATAMARQTRLAEITRQALESLGQAFDVITPVIPNAGDIVQQVIRELDRADIVVADLTGNNPSVLYEVAVRHCTGLPCIHVRDKDAAEGEPLAFDVRQYRYADVDFGLQAKDHKDLVKMLGSAIGEVDGPATGGGDPVTTFFKVPLTDVYPASGLAIGYLQNFVVRVAETVANARAATVPPTIAVPGEEPLKLTKEDWAKVALAIWIPDRNEFVLPKYIDVLKMSGEICDATLPGPGNSRGMTVLFRRDTLQIVDIPTTLRAVATNVSGHLGLDTADGQKMLAREFDRFGRTLDYWKKKSVEMDKLLDRIGEHTRFLDAKVKVTNLPKDYRIAAIA